MDNTKLHALFDLLPELEAGKYDSYEMQDKMIHAVYELSLQPFDWPGWEYGKELITKDNPDLSNCSTETLCKLLLMLTRADRFNDGLLMLNLKKGKVTKIIKALKNKVVR